MHTLTYARSGAPLLDRLPRPLQALHAFYHTTVTTYPFIVTAVYWGAIHRGQPWFATAFAAWSNTSQHALNSALALFELLAARAPPPPWAHAPWLVVVLALYLALAYLTYYTKGFYPYSFLDVQAQGSAATAGWVLAIAAAALVVYCLVRALVLARLWLTETKCGMRGRFFAGRPPAAAPAASLASTADVEMGRYRNDDAKSATPVSVMNSNEF